MSGKEQFDLVVIGGGPGGYTAAFRAADLGLNVCLVEQDKELGGVCLKVGCIPSKTLLHAASIIEETEKIRAFGIHYTEPIVNVDQLRAKKESVVATLTAGLESLSAARKIDRIQGKAVFTSSTSLDVLAANGQLIQNIYFSHAIISTGSRPIELPMVPDSERVWDSTLALSLPFIPKKLLIIGGGIISLEMAQVYHRLGSEITIVEAQDQIIPAADKDIIRPLLLGLKKLYTIKTKVKVSHVKVVESKIEVETEEHRQKDINLYDAVLVAIGRRPNSENLGLKKIGVHCSSDGFIEVDVSQRTSVNNIFAIGDVVGNPMLAHKASHQAKVAAEVISGKKSAFTPLTIPSVAYTNPEIAWIGLTEKDIKEQGIEYEKGTFFWGASGRALTSGNSAGVSKALFSKQTGRLLGAAICGAHAGELIHEAILAQEMGADAEDISKTIHAHPSLSETFALACEMVDGSITDALPSLKS